MRHKLYVGSGNTTITLNTFRKDTLLRIKILKVPII